MRFDGMRLRVAALALAAAFVQGCGEGGDGGVGGDGLVSGTGGSTARMTIVDDRLYAIAGDSVQLFDLTEPASPNPWTRVTLDWNIQTLFPHGDYLLVGAANGVHLLDNRDRAAPVKVGEFTHALASDPVVARGDRAWVTLRRDPTRPPPQVDPRLDVLDIADVTAPTLLETVPMRAPAGLAVAGERLFVCDGADGLKTFDLADGDLPRLIDTLPDVRCHDLIARADLLYVVSEHGLTQYDLTTGRPLELSVIERAPVVYVVDR